MSYIQRTVRGGNLNSLASGSRGSNQPGPSKNVLPPTNSRTVESDPLADCSEDGYDLMDVLDSMSTGDTVQVEEFKEEEYELEEYVLMDPNESAVAAPQPKRVRFDTDTSSRNSSTRQFQTTGRATPATKVVVQTSQPTGSPRLSGTNQQKKALATYSPAAALNNSTAKQSQVRVVPTERLRMAPTTTSNSGNNGAMLTGVQPNSISAPQEKKIMLQYVPPGTTTAPVGATANKNVKGGVQTPPLLQAYGTKQLHVKIVPLNTLSIAQMQQLKAPLAGITSAVKGNPLAAKTAQPGAVKPQNSMSISVIPTTQNNTPVRQGYSISTNSIKLMTPVGKGSTMPSFDPLDPSAIQSAVAQLNNPSFTITRVAPPIQETDEKCTIDLDTLDNKHSILQEDPLATSSELPVSVQQSNLVPLQPFTSVTPADPLATSFDPLVSVQQGSAAHTLSRIIPIRQPITPGNPLAASSASPTVVKLVNTSLTVTRIGDQPAVPGDPLATTSAPPPVSRLSSTGSLTVTRINTTMPQNGVHSAVNVGASTSTKPPPPLVQLKKPTVTVTKIVTSSVPPTTSAKAAPVRITARVQPTSNGPKKKCDCRTEIAKRLKLLDERTRQMESYMNDLIDLIQPDTDFEINPITSRDELERLNYDLGSSPQYLQKVKKWLDQRITARDTHWRMVDTMNLLFDNDFLAQCSWKNASKIALYSYTYIIELFKFVGTTALVKVTIICVGNFFMKQIKSVQAKMKKALQENNSKDADDQDDGSSGAQETNAPSEKGAPIEKDATNQEDEAGVENTIVQEATTGQADAPNQEDATDTIHTIIEHELNNHDGEEYLDDEFLDDTTYQDDSQTMSSDA